MLLKLTVNKTRRRDAAWIILPNLSACTHSNLHLRVANLHIIYINIYIILILMKERLDIELFKGRHILIRKLCIASDNFKQRAD